MAEFQAEGQGVPEDNSMVGGDILRYHPRWRDPGVFAEYVESVRADAREDTPRPECHVPATSLWYVDSETCLGQIAVRNVQCDWAMERTLGWLSRARRLNRDHERRPDHHTQMVWWAALITLTRKLAKERLHWPEFRPGRLDPRPA
ncbi:hypothetical protein ABIA33_006861 [Streptacidiphilus sp. MAP12-16]|uniref:hypothetical protein n=1 Tax=Streptacidiphilus sp. MAP12-16 TaxID=3156300 RepID=UPI00351903C9